MVPEEGNKAWCQAQRNSSVLLVVLLLSRCFSSVMLSFQFCDVVMYVVCNKILYDSYNTNVNETCVTIKNSTPLLALLVEDNYSCAIFLGLSRDVPKTTRTTQSIKKREEMSLILWSV